MNIGKTYKRTSPEGEVSIITIETQGTLEYHRQLEEHGFIYEEVKDTSPNVCTACHA